MIWIVVIMVGLLTLMFSAPVRAEAILGTAILGTVVIGPGFTDKHRDLPKIFGTDIRLDIEQAIQ